MNIHLLSDLHLEFGSYNLSPTGHTLLLAGDIMVVSHLFKNASGMVGRYRSFFDQAHDQFERVFMIAGNHEFYGGDIVRSREQLREWLSQWPRVTLLEDQSVELSPGWRLWGSTMWTDFGGDPRAENQANLQMNDFRVIQNGDRGFRAAQSAEICRHSLASLGQALQDYPDDKWVVMTHHAPSSRSVAPQWRGSDLNPAFHSDFDHWIMEREQIGYWVHGHMHTPADHWIGSTRVLCNPRGYHGREFDENFRDDFSFALAVNESPQGE